MGIGGLSPIHWIVIIALVLILFGGRGKLSSLMGDAAKGIRAFKEGLKADDDGVKVATAPLTEAEKEKAAAER